MDNRARSERSFTPAAIHAADRPRLWRKAACACGGGCPRCTRVAAPTAVHTAERLYPDEKERAKHFAPYPGELWVDIIEPVTTATLDWQVAWNATSQPFKLDENGKLDDPTLKAFKTQGYDPTGKSIDWTAKDRAEFKAIRGEEEEARQEAERGGGSSFTLRQQIVNVAQSQVWSGRRTRCACLRGRHRRSQ